MAIATSGPISFSDLRAEFDSTSTGAIKFSDFYRTNGSVPDTPTALVNSTVPTGGTIKVSQLKGKSATTVVTYEIIGGGGGGGYGKSDSYGSGRAGSGTDTFLEIKEYSSEVFVEEVRSAGGLGGRNAYKENPGYGQAPDGGRGQSSYYGSGSSWRGYNSSASAAASTSYGAGGGGAGGDASSDYDSSGGGGEGGLASTRVTGNVIVRFGSEIRSIVGAKGTGGNSTYDGGNGAGGYTKISFNSLEQSYTSAGTFTKVIQ